MNRQDFVERCRALANPSLVQVNAQAIAQLAIEPGSVSLVGGSVPFEFEPGVDDARVLRYLLVLTALQYRFWDVAADGTFQRYQFEGRVGSTGMIHAFDLAWGSSPEPGESLCAAAQSLDGTKAVFGEHFPDPQSRQSILSETLSGAGIQVCAEVLARVQRQRAVTVELAGFVAQALPRGYADPFLKKAMLFLGLAASYLRLQYPVRDELCAYADYQVPSVLRHYGVLQYSSTLAQSVDDQVLLASGSPEETAIRAATILACEDIAQAVGVTAAEVDWWCFVQRKQPVRPFHLTPTTHY